MLQNHHLHHHFYLIITKIAPLKPHNPNIEGSEAGIYRSLELASEMLTKLDTSIADIFIALYIVERCTSNESGPSPASPFLLDLTLKK